MKLTLAIGERIKELLFKKNMTQYKLGKLTCLTHTSISKIVNGKTTDIKLSTLMLICEALDIELEDLVATPLLKRQNLDF